MRSVRAPPTPLPKTLAVFLLVSLVRRDEGRLGARSSELSRHILYIPTQDRRCHRDFVIAGTLRGRGVSGGNVRFLSCWGPGWRVRCYMFGMCCLPCVFESLTTRRRGLVEGMTSFVLTSERNREVESSILCFVWAHVKCFTTVASLAQLLVM